MQRIREFRAPAEPLEKTLENNRPKRRYGENGEEIVDEGNSTFYLGREDMAEGPVSSPSTGGVFHFCLRFCLLWFFVYSDDPR